MKKFTFLCLQRRILMKTNRAFRLAMILIIMMSSLGCDQVSKNIIRNKFDDDESVSLVNDHLTITRVQNSGAFFGWGESLPSTAKNILLSLIPVLAISGGLFFLFFGQATSNAVLIGLSFILGGGIGNIFDRIIHGSVTDFLYIHFGILRTGIFNLADVSITTGTFIIIIHSLANRWRTTSFDRH